MWKFYEFYDWTHKFNLVLIIDQNGRLISASDDKSIKIWNIETEECIKTLSGHTEKIWSLALTEKGILFSCSSDASIKIWDLKSGLCLRTLTGHSSYVYTLVIFNDELFSGSEDKSIKV